MSDSSWLSTEEQREALEGELRSRLLKIFSDFKQECGELYEYVDNDGNGNLASVLLEAIEESIDDATWLEFLAELLGSTVEAVGGGPDGFVYILKAGEFYKIGKAKTLGPRIRTLKIQLPFSAEVWHAFPCENYSQSELHLHEWFSRERVNGEWFRLPDDALTWLATVQYMTTPRGEYAEVAGRADIHTRLPAAVREDARWAAAFAEARTAKDEIR